MLIDIYVVYVDMFFLINFILDYILLSITALLMYRSKKKNKVRTIAGAAFGGIYSIIILKPLLNHLKSVTLISVLVAFLMVLIAFGFSNITTYLKNVAFLVLASFFMAGVLNFLYYSTSTGKIFRGMLYGDSSQGINARRFVLATVIAYLVMIIASKMFMLHKINSEIIYEVKISYQGKSVVVKGLFDTGNTLSDPIYGEMVHIAEERIFVTLLEDGRIPEDKMMIIPYLSVGNKDGILYGMRMDELLIENGDKEIRILGPIFAKYKGVLADKDRFSVILNGKSLME